MVMEEFTRQAGINAKPVPYPGCMPDNVKSVIEGSTDYTTGVLNAIKVFGKFTKTLAIFTDERHPLAPEIPTAKEEGYDIGWGRVGMGWGGLSAKAGTPEDRLEKLRTLFGKWIQSEEFIRRSAKVNVPITYTPPEEFYQLWIKSEELLKPAVERIKKGN
jgi:tripartite-type tricarboxylate transporter receptor subunit TctC